MSINVNYIIKGLGSLTLGQNSKPPQIIEEGPPIIKIKKTKKRVKPKPLGIQVKPKPLPPVNFNKWSSYERSLVVPFTLNPADFSRGFRCRSWCELKVKAQRDRIIKAFKAHHYLFNDYLITFEYSEKGRFHAHGLFYLKDLKHYSLFVNYIYNEFGFKNNKRCFEGVPFRSLEQLAFDKSFNYVTKDINYMYLTAHIRYYQYQQHQAIIDNYLEINKIL